MATQRLSDLTEALLHRARAAGADAADAIAAEGRSISVDVRAGKLEQAERSEAVEIGLRVLVGQRQACVSASDISERTLDEIATRAVTMARLAPADPTIGLADPSQLATDRDVSAFELVDPSAAPASSDLERDALEAEAAARAVRGVSQVDQSSASYSWQAVHLAATNGFSGGYERSSRAVSTVAITGEGLSMERDWAAESRTFQCDLPSPTDIGRRAGERAVANANPRRPRTGAFPVLFDERISGSLVGHLLAAINGTTVARGASWLRDGMGTQVLPAGMSLIEDPRRPRVSGSRPFDAEGLPTARRAIVQDGVLQGWTLDLGTGRKLGMPSTANAVRGVSAPPSPSVGNVALTQGTRTRDELIREMGTGLIVTSFIGATINPTTGDYSRGISGFWVENGEIQYPINECTIAGNLHEMLRTLTPANDARGWVSHIVPSLLVEGLILAGE